MGQHKKNPTAILAKEGKIPPKQKRISERELHFMAMKKVYGKLLDSEWLKQEGLK